MKKRAIRIAVLVGVILVVVVALVALSATPSKTTADKAWDVAFTEGSPTAKNHFIMYTDLACPYCDAFSHQIAEHKEDFKSDYIEKGDILFEIRLTDFLYEYGAHKMDFSRQSAEAGHCAAAEGKFMDYYYAAIEALWNDYHSEGIGTSANGPAITNMTEQYWLDIGKKIGLGESFENCYKNHEKLDQVKEWTARAAKTIGGGVPYFQFNRFTNNGFDQSWGWGYVKAYLDAGLAS